MLNSKQRGLFYKLSLVSAVIAVVSLGYITLVYATNIGDNISTDGSITGGSLILGNNSEDVLSTTASTSSASSGLYWGNKKIDNPMDSFGDLIYGGVSGLISKLSGNTSATKKFLSQTGDGNNSAVPAWSSVSYDNLSGEDYIAQYKAINEAIIHRTHNAVVVVDTTIQAAIDSISDNSYSKRYLVYVPNGTYDEELTLKSYVDIVGESKEGVIVQSSSGTNDTIMAGGRNILLANMTINHTFNLGDSGVHQYPIHLDSNSDDYTPLDSSDTILFNIDVNSYGTNAKSSIGMGLRDRQRVYLLNSNFYSEEDCGIFGHNQLNQNGNVQLYVINTNSTSDAAHALQWSNLGSDQSDMIYVYGGTFDSVDSGDVYDIIVNDNDAYEGAGETYISIDDNVTFDTISLVDSDKRLSLPISMVSIPNPPQGRNVEYRGSLFTGSLGIAISSDGIITSSRADKSMYLKNDDGYIGFFNTGYFRPSTDIFKMALTSDKSTYITGINALDNNYVRIAADNTMIAQLSAVSGAYFYEPLIVTSNSYISQNSGLSNSFDGLTTFSNGVNMSDSYLKIDDNDGVPASADCDNDSEAGRMVLDTNNERVYVCNGATRGWDYFTLTD